MLRSVRATTVAEEKAIKYYIFRVCVRSLKYPACNAHPPYCHPWHVRLCNIFSTFMYGTIFATKLLSIKRVF
jgi:hypothetical protein